MAKSSAPVKIAYTKPALLYSDQLQRLKDRGLVFNNDSKALHLLENISYYRLSGYWHPLLADPKTDHVFIAGSKFETAFKLYCFDKELRKLIINELEKIEIAIRAKMIYLLSHRYGPFWYSDSNLFSHPGKFGVSISKMDEEFQRTDEVFIKEFKKKYTDPIPPSWMMLEITTFGGLSILYENLASVHDKRDIASYFGLDAQVFQSWLHTIVYVRNVCAHHSRLWNRVMRITPKVPLTPTYSFIEHQFHATNNRTFFILSMILYLLNIINPKHTFKLRLKLLFQNYPDVDIKALGFPNGWESSTFWNWKKVRIAWHKRILYRFMKI